jgi:hypothetical protein
MEILTTKRYLLAAEKSISLKIILWQKFPRNLKTINFMHVEIIYQTKQHFII